MIRKFLHSTTGFLRVSIYEKDWRTRLDHALMSGWRANEVRKCPLHSQININNFSLGQFNKQGDRILMEDNFHTNYDQSGKLLVKVKKTLNRLYL